VIFDNIANDTQAALCDTQNTTFDLLCSIFFFTFLFLRKKSKIQNSFQEPLSEMRNTLTPTMMSEVFTSS
jgi:hypothetical protein